jgi:hypothetical protein
MWAPMAVGLLIAVLGQASAGAAGLAIAYAVLFVLVVGYGVRRGVGRHRAS